MGEDTRHVAEYFVICGLPTPGNQHQLEEGDSEVNLKPSHNLDPITDITVIFPGLGENVPDYYELLEVTPSGLPADLNHGSFRAPEVFICYRRSKDRPPLVEVGILSDPRERISPGTQLVEFTPHNHIANVNNSSSTSTFITYRRATELNPCNEFVVMDLAVVIASRGETPPHTFIKIDKSLNKGMVGSDVFLCYKRQMNRSDYISYKPGLLDRYPIHNTSSVNVDINSVPLFCLPLGANLECRRTGSTNSDMNKSTFVLTQQNRDKLYGSAISFYEEYDENLLTDEQKSLLRLENYKHPSERKILTNKCICLLSKWPFFDAFEKFLFFIYKRLLMGPFDIPLERYISHFLYSVPFPCPERPRILVQLSPLDIIALYQPQELTIPRSGASFRLLVTTLGPDNCLLLLLLALTERKILIHSLRSDVVTAVCEAVMQIIFPINWHNPYIPLCPIGMAGYLSAPCPFVYGMDSRFFDLYEQPSDVYAVDLDTNTISGTNCGEAQLNVKMLPRKPAKILKNSLSLLQEKCLQHNRHAQRLEMENDDSIDFVFKLRDKENSLETEIQEAFLVFMASILGGYRSNLLPITRAPTEGETDVANLFDIPGFLRSRDKNHHQFYKDFMKTQIFTKFIEDCSFVSDVNTSLAFFDECVLQLERDEGGRLLESDGSVSDRTVFILPPDASDLPNGVEYKTSTLEKFDHSLFKELPMLGGSDITSSNKRDQFKTPASSLAKRTKQEKGSAVKIARKHLENPLLWAKCLLASCYSIWYLHLPSMVLQNKGSMSSLRQGHHLLERMQRLRLHPVDEICYRVMMQLCGLYSQPVLAVKVYFEMRRHGVHPNAVTYGHYNKAVLESEWPQGIASGSQLLWHKLRNVLTAIWLFKQAGKERKLKRDGDNLSLESGVSHSEMEVDGTSRKEEDDTNDNSDGKEESECRNSNGSHDVGYSSMNDQPGVIDPEVTEDTRRSLERTRSYSIVKPPNTETCDMDDSNDCDTTENALEEVNETIVAEDKSDRKSVKEIWTKEDADDDETPTGKPRPLFKQDSQESALSEKVRAYLEGSPVSRGSEVRDLSEVSGKSCSTESLEILECLPDSPEKSIKDVSRRLPTLKEIASVDAEVGSLERSGSRSHLEITPVTLNDPLGALSSQTSPTTTPAKDKASTLPNGRSMSMSDVLGEPFSTPVSSKTSNNMQRSSTMPLNSDGENSPQGSTPSVFGSISSLAGSGMKSLTSSKAANLGFRRGKALLSSALSGFSPQTSKNLSTLRSGLSSAATNLSKRYEEMTLSSSPAPSSDQVPDEDRVSQSSNDSRRQSEAVQIDGIPQDTWSTLTEVLGNYLWGDNARAQPSSNQTQRAADITEQFETLYSRAAAEAEEDVRPVAMSVIMSTCSRCHSCGSILYDEEIMAGWTAEDSNLNTICPFCKEKTVPSLVTMVTDLRSSPPVSQSESSSKSCDPLSSQSQRSHPLQSYQPVKHKPISVPYLSPLVLRKELENILDKEGDCCLTKSSFPDLHPEIYWNLLYYFHRIAVPSHLPGVLLSCPSLNRENDGRTLHPGWEDCDHRNVRLVTRWDNDSLYSDESLPLHIQWRKRNCAADPKVVHPLMQSVIKGVRENDLKYCVESIIRERVKKEETSSPRGMPRASRVSDTSNSVYRETLFLTLVSLGQDNIDLTAFDREYRRAFEKLRHKEMIHTIECDKPPTMGVLFCRKLFRELRV